MNLQLITGRLTKDPEVRMTGTGKTVTKLSVATNEKISADKEVSTYHDVICWQGLGEAAGDNLSKGDAVIVVGRAAKRSYEKDGVKKYISELVADCVAIDVRSMAKKAAQGSAGQVTKAFSGTVVASSEDEDLPF